MRLNFKFYCLSVLGALVCFLSSPVSADTWNGGGDGTNWEDGTNWAGGIAPGSTGFGPGATAGERTVGISGPNNGSLIVNLNSDFTAVPVHDMRWDANGNSGSLTVNLGANAKVSGTHASNTILTISEGGTGTAAASSTVNVGGELTAGQIRLARDSGTTTLRVTSGGSLTMSGGGHFDIRTDRNSAGDATAIFEMTGGSFSSGGNRSLFMGANDSQLIFSGGSNFDGSNLTFNALSSTAGSITINGSAHALLDVKAVIGNANTNWNFNADAAGVTSLNTINDLDLASGSLTVDLAGYSGTAPLVLFDYGTLGSGGTAGVNDVFGSVTVNNGSGTIDYNFGGGNQIALVVAVPEPTTLLPLGLAMVGLVSRRRRK